MSPRFVSCCAVALAIGIVAGCGGSSSPGDTTDGGVIDCSHDPRAMNYAPGLSVTSTGKQMKFTLLSSDPAPPARGTDTWKVAVANASGQPLTALALQVLPFMPDHAHGSSVTPTVSTNQDGTYTVSNLYLFMPGIWQITFGATPPGGTADSAVYYFCVPG
jgi:YtkA-like